MGVPIGFSLAERRGGNRSKQGDEEADEEQERFKPNEEMFQSESEHSTPINIEEERVSWSL
jgi:hypothetical protein